MTIFVGVFQTLLIVWYPFIFLVQWGMDVGSFVFSVFDILLLVYNKDNVNIKMFIIYTYKFIIFVYKKIN